MLFAGVIVPVQVIPASGAATLMLAALASGPAVNSRFAAASVGISISPPVSAASILASNAALEKIPVSTPSAPPVELMKLEFARCDAFSNRSVPASMIVLP